LNSHTFPHESVICFHNHFTAYQPEPTIRMTNHFL